MTPAPDPPVFLGMPRPEKVDPARCLIGNATRGGLVARGVTLLSTRWQRARMLFGRKLSVESGLFLPSPAGIHSLGARHGLRVLFLGKGMRVFFVAPRPPWRTLRPPSPAWAALFLHERNPAVVRPEDRLEWIGAQPRIEERAAWLQSPAPAATSSSPRPGWESAG
ncbi:MAG: hypothetical protein ACE5H3_05590 [Planctomycetota bacterium]